MTAGAGIGVLSARARSRGLLAQTRAPPTPHRAAEDPCRPHRGKPTRALASSGQAAGGRPAAPNRMLAPCIARAAARALAPRGPHRPPMMSCQDAVPRHASGVPPSPNVTWQPGGVPSSAKEAALGQRGCVVWLTGLSGAGKSAVGAAVEGELAARGVATALLDGDNLRHGLCADLGFSESDRAENVRRAGEAARLLAEAGLVAVAALVSPYAAHRAAARARLPPGRFIEVHVDTPLAVCAARDPKALYAAARGGALVGLTGVDAPYEAPVAPEVRLVADGREPVPVLARRVVAFLEGAGLVPHSTERAAKAGSRKAAGAPSRAPTAAGRRE